MAGAFDMGSVGLSLDSLIGPAMQLPGKGAGLSAALDALILQYMRLHDELDRHMKLLETAQREVGCTQALHTADTPIATGHQVNACCMLHALVAGSSWKKRLHARSAVGARAPLESLGLTRIP